MKPAFAAFLLTLPAATIPPFAVQLAAQQPRPGAPAPAAVAPAANPAGAQGGAQVPPVQEEGDYYVLNFAETSEDGVSLEEFVKICQEATGRNFTYSKNDSEQLKANKVRMFGSKRIPKSDFYPFFQIMMFINDFACIEVGPPHLSVIVIQSLTPGRQQNTTLAKKPIYVLPEELSQYEDQPAVLIRTVLHLPNTDVRQLSNSLRSVQGGNANEQIINAGNTNAVILEGFGSNIAALAKLLQLVDEASRIDEGVEPVFDFIRLEFAAPEDVADIIEQVLEARTKASQDARRAVPVNPEGAGGSFSRGSTEAKILVDKRTQSLVVMAMPDDLPRIKDLIARLDVEVPDPERNYHIYILENVKAEDLQKVLKDFLQDASRLTDSATGTGGRTPGATGGGSSSSRSNEVVVVADKETNSLLIAANKTRYGEILELIRQLDRRQDQVLIETALIELTGTDTRDIGVELGLSDVNGDGGFGLTSFGLSTFQDTDNDGIPDVKVPAQLSGLTGGILSGKDFALPVLVRLLQTKKNSNVLNIPSVLVNNNGKAEVTTKDEQPTTQITATGVGGQTQENFQNYQEAGTTLTISPSISASRYLRLSVSLKVSNFVGTFSGPIPPPRITRELKTEVNVPDGDTMVIGGIVTDNKSESRDQTPWLGDIPLLGALFSRDTNTSTRTTLYFFVTPHIMKDRDFADLAEISYRRKLEAVEVMGKDRMHLVQPDFGKEGEVPDLTPFEIPLYKSPERGESSGHDVGLDAHQQAARIREARQEEGAPAAAAAQQP